MKFTRESPAAVMIRNVGDGEISIGNERYRNSLALTNEGILDGWTEKPVADLTADDLDSLLATDPELIVLGTGAENLFAPREITFALARKGIGLEVMNTAAAARTFNVLASEGRRVAAVLYV